MSSIHRLMCMAIAILFILTLPSTTTSATAQIVGWPSSSGTSLPAGTSNIITIYGSSFGVSTAVYTLSSPSLSTLTPTSVSNTEITFTIPAGTAGATSIWSLNYLPSSTVLKRIPVIMSSKPIAFPYSRSISFPVNINGVVSTVIPAVFLLKRTEQNIVHIELLDSFSFPAPPTGNLLTSNTPIPEEFRPARTQRCYAHTVVYGTPTELHVDIRETGILAFSPTVSGDVWTTMGEVYFNGCTWIPAF